MSELTPEQVRAGLQAMDEADDDTPVREIRARAEQILASSAPEPSSQQQAREHASSVIETWEGDIGPLTDAGEPIDAGHVLELRGIIEVHLAEAMRTARREGESAARADEAGRWQAKIGALANTERAARGRITTNDLRALLEGIVR